MPTQSTAPAAPGIPVAAAVAAVVFARSHGRMGAC